MVARNWALFVFLVVELVFAEDCVNKFCPPGTYCEAKYVVKCANPPCKPIFACLPVSTNGCASMECASGLVCVEKVVPCISRDCKKVGVCARPGTCDAQECPPSHRCKIESGKPTCVRGILTLSDVVAQLPQRPANEPE